VRGGVLPIKIRDYTYLLVHSLHYLYRIFFSKIKNHSYIIVKTSVKIFMDEMFLLLIKIIKSIIKCTPSKVFFL
jgi:hypothetical protein